MIAVQQCGMQSVRFDSKRVLFKVREREREREREERGRRNR